MARRPRNVLLLWTDEQRADAIGACGDPRLRTPHLDRLAAGGAVFEQAYCTQPVCSPSRASVLTGLYPHTHGVRECNVPLDPAVPTIATLLRSHGYAGGCVGKWHLGHELRPQHGFVDRWVSTEDMYTHFDQVTGQQGEQGGDRSDYHQFLVSRGYVPPDKDRLGPVFSRETAARLPEEVGKPAFQAAEAIRFLETYRDRPFILSVNFLEPHFPYFGPSDGTYDPEEMVLPDTWYGEMEQTVPRHYRLRRRMYAERNHYVETNNRAPAPAGAEGVGGMPDGGDERGWKALKARSWPGLFTGAGGGSPAGAIGVRQDDLRQGTSGRG